MIKRCHKTHFNPPLNLCKMYAFLSCNVINLPFHLKSKWLIQNKSSLSVCHRANSKNLVCYHFSGHWKHFLPMSNPKKYPNIKWLQKCKCRRFLQYSVALFICSVAFVYYIHIFISKTPPFLCPETKRTVLHMWECVWVCVMVWTAQGYIKMCVCVCLPSCKPMLKIQQYISSYHYIFLSITCYFNSHFYIKYLYYQQIKMIYITLFCSQSCIT